MRPSDRAWLALAAGIAIYDIAAPEGETLSEGCDRYRGARPLLTYLILAAVAGHLARIVPYRLDPLHGFGLVALRAKGHHVPG